MVLKCSQGPYKYIKTEFSAENLIFGKKTGWMGVLSLGPPVPDPKIQKKFLFQFLLF